MLITILFFLLSSLKVSGGSEIHLKACWSQKLSYKDGQFIITIPFNFPEYVTPIPKVFSKGEKIQLNVNSGTEKEVLCQNASHPLKVNILMGH